MVAGGRDDLAGPREGSSSQQSGEGPDFVNGKSMHRRNRLYDDVPTEWRNKDTKDECFFRRGGEDSLRFHRQNIEDFSFFAFFACLKVFFLKKIGREEEIEHTFCKHLSFVMNIFK